MVGSAALLNASTGVLTALFAAIVLAGNHRRTANVFLAGFLLLIAGNLFANVLRFSGDPLGMSWLFWYRVASVFSALDPFFLYYFAAVFPERNALGETWKVATVGALSAVLAISAITRTPQPGAGFALPIEILWVVFTAVVYTVVLVSLGRRYLTDQGSRPTRLLFYGLLAATFPTWARIPLWAGVRETMAALVPGIGRSAVDGRGTLEFVLVQAVLLGGVALGLWAIHRFAPSRSRPWSRRRADTLMLVVAWGVAFLTFSTTVDRFLWDIGVVEAGQRLLGGFALPARRAGSAIRWTLFSALTSVAVVRHQMLGLSLRGRRRVARVLVACGFLTVTGAFLLAVSAVRGGGLPELRGFDLLVLALVLGASQRFQKLIDRAAELLYGVPMPGDLGAAVETYRQAANEATAAGRGLEEDPELERLAGELGLESRTVEAIHATVRGAEDETVAVGEAIRGRYRVTRLLHRGTTGRVYLGHDEVLDREVVLKVIPRTDDRAAAGLEEARLAGGLDHPNVVTVYDVLELADADVLVTEHVAGGDLEAWLEDHGPLTVDTAVELVDGILAGLDAVHDAGVVHRDLKPSNVLVAADGTPKVADLGVARVRQGATRTLADADEVAGTPTWMAPEQLDGKVATERSDVYAAGRLMAEVVDGPLPTPLAEIQATATAEDPRDRYASAEAMRRALLEARPAA